MTTRFPDGAISVDGVVTAPADARVAAMDHGFLFGDSVYEVIRTIDGRPTVYAEHLARMRQSGASIYLDLPWSDDEIRAQVRATVVATDLPELYVRIVATRGVGPMSLLPDRSDTPSLIAYALPLREPSEETQRTGVRIAVPNRIRNDARALAPAAKTGNYLNNLLALVEARRGGGVDAVLVNASGDVTEGTTSNVFWVRGGELYTPSLASGILAGITRAVLLAALPAAGVTVHEGEFPLEELLGADEVFLTGTVKGVLAVVSVDEHTVGDGRPGPVTAKVAEVSRQALRDRATDW